MPNGVLDLLDRADKLLGEIEMADALDRAATRRCRVAIQNARLTVQEARRRLERIGHETKT